MRLADQGSSQLHLLVRPIHVRIQMALNLSPAPPSAHLLWQRRSRGDGRGAEDAPITRVRASVSIEPALLIEVLPQQMGQIMGLCAHIGRHENARACAAVPPHATECSTHAAPLYAGTRVGAPVPVQGFVADAQRRGTRCAPPLLTTSCAPSRRGARCSRLAKSARWHSSRTPARSPTLAWRPT